MSKSSQSVESDAGSESRLIETRNQRYFSLSLCR